VGSAGDAVASAGDAEGSAADGDKHGLDADVKSAVKTFFQSVTEAKTPSLKKTEKAMWERVAMWDGLQERLLTVMRRVSVQAANDQERQQLVVATGGGVRSGLGRYVSNFFINLEEFNRQYQQRAPLGAATRQKLQRLHTMVSSRDPLGVKPDMKKAGLAPSNDSTAESEGSLQSMGVDEEEPLPVENIERELREVIGEAGLPLYTSGAFDHRLEAYTNDALFVDHMLRLSESALQDMQARNRQRSLTASVTGSVSTYFEICIEVIQMAGLRKVPIRWLVDPRASAASRWPSINYFDTS